MRTKLWAGLIIVLGCLASLVVAFLPKFFIKPQAGTPGLYISTNCPEDEEVRIYLTVRSYRLWQARALVDVAISPIRNCKSITIGSSEELEAVELFVSGFGTQKYRTQVPTAVNSSGTKDYTVAIPDAEKDWGIVAKGAFVATRSGFASVSFHGIVSLLTRGTYSIRVEGQEDYEILGGEKIVTARVLDPKAVMQSDHVFGVTGRFFEIDAFREIFAILLSTLLGVGATLVIEDVFARRRRS